MEIRRLAADEGLRLRALRLRALDDAPRAFASSLERERALPDAYWHDHARRSATGAAGAVFVAVDAGEWRAMAGWHWFDEEARIAQLWGMWVEPFARGQGLGRSLVDEVAQWTGERGARLLRLGVVDRAAEVAAFYERLGFRRTGETKALAPDGRATAFFLARDLSPPRGEPPAAMTDNRCP